MSKKHEKEKSIIPRDLWTAPSIFDEMERVFDDFRTGMMDFWMPSLRAAPRMPAVDIKDTGKEYVVEVELPGMRKEDVEIEIVEGGLRILANRKEETEERGEGYLRRERGYLSFSRHLPLPENIDADKIEAKLTDGVLQVSIPKIEGAEEKKRIVEVK